MARIIKMIVLLTFIPSVYALVAGEEINFSVENCNEWVVLKVESDNNISEGEYWIEGCDNTQDGLWMCYCQNITTNLVMHTLPKTVNTYGITISYEYRTPGEIMLSSGGGGGTRTERAYILLQNKTYEDTCDDECPVIIPEEPAEDSPKEERGGGGAGPPLERAITVTEPKKSYSWMVWIVIISGLLVIGAIVGYTIVYNARK